MLEIAGVLSNTERQEQMQMAIDKGFPLMKKAKGFSDGVLQIICYGPSLHDTWREINREGFKMTVSGAHDFLADRNIQATWHVEIDPRAHKAKMLRNPRPSTKYLMASCCHPDFWDTLYGHNVELWHLINGNDFQTVDWIAENHPKGLSSMIGGGSTVGQRAMNVAAALGFRRFDFFGLDCSFERDRHAASHTGEPEPVIETTLHTSFGKKVFTTTPQLLQAAGEITKFLMETDVEVTFHGQGMMQTIAADLRRIHK